MKHLRITLNGQTYEVDVEETGAVAAAAPAAAPAPTPAPAPAAPAPAPAPASAAGGKIVEAPMSGRIVKVLVNVGDRVSADDPVVILEAMKLENEIYADVDGVVKEIRVTANQIVNTEDVIAVIG